MMEGRKAGMMEGVRKEGREEGVKILQSSLRGKVLTITQKLIDNYAGHYTAMQSESFVHIEEQNWVEAKQYTQEWEVKHK